MTTKTTLRYFLAIAGSLLIAFSSASAANRYWDGGSVDIGTDGNGASAGGDGTWDTTIQNWDAGAVPHVAWNNDNNDTAIFAGTAGTVTLGSPVTVGGLTFNTANYILTNGTLTLAGSATISNGVTATISSSIAGSSGLLKTGAGTLIITNANSFSGGVFINGGNLKIAAGMTEASLGDPGNVVTFTGTATNQFSSVITLSQGFAVNEGVVATLDVGNINKITINNSLTGSGALVVRGASDPGGSCEFTGTNNTFSGDILCYNSSGAAYGGTLSLASLADTPGRRIKMGTGTGAFSYGAGAVVPLVLSNRQIELVSGGHGKLSNNATNVNCTVTVNMDLLVSGTGIRTFTLGGSNTGKNRFVGVITNGTGSTISLTKRDGGMWIANANHTYTGSTAVSGGTLILSGTNTYTGATTISGNATLVIQSIANYGVNCSIGAASSGSIAIGNSDYTGVLVYRGDTAACDRTVQVGSDNSGYVGGATILNYGTGDLTFTANPFNTTYANGNSNTRTLTLGGTRGGTIAGVIQNNSATYRAGFAKTGSGTWTLQGNNTFTGASSAAGGGNLVLDYTTNTGSKLADTAILTLGGSTITLKGGSGLTEVVTNTTLSAGASFITRDGGDTKLQLNAITRQAGGNISFVDGAIATTDTANTNGILGGWATIGSDWAINSSGGADGAITNLTSYTGDLPSTGTGSATANYTLSGDQAQTGTSDLNAWTVKITGTGTLALAGTTIQIQNGSATSLGGILYAGGASDVYNITANAAKGIKTTGTQDLIINTVSGTLNVSAKINIGDSSRTLLKAGAGTLILSSSENAYTGITRVNEGALRLASANAAGTIAGGIVVQNNAALELSNNITVGAETLTIAGSGISNGGALKNVSGNNTYGGAITIGNDGARINSASGLLTLTGGMTISQFATLTFGGAGDISVSGAPAITGSPSLVKDGIGKLALVIADTSTSLSFNNLALNGGTLEIKFNVAPSATVPAVQVWGDLTTTGTPTISIAVDEASLTGIDYPLFVVVGNAPTAVPTLTGLSGRSLVWGGTDNKTLILTAPSAGTVIIVE